MADNQLYIAFLWHMHQPYYKDPLTGVYRLPWVRLHGIKDYYDMVAILKDFPGIYQTFNIVPSLLEQIMDYADGNVKDNYLEMALYPAKDLNIEQKVFILENFFYANWDNMIRPFPRYWELLIKRGMNVSHTELERVSRYFTPADFLDLQVIFNLAWFDPMFRTEDGFLKELIKKGRGFTEEEKAILINKQMELMRMIIPEYRRMMERGQVELTTSPFYHPILPLLYDTNSARMALPEIKLPQNRFSHPEDAVRQIAMAVEYHERAFGKRPEGMWPSEGSVSYEVIDAFIENGIKWIATDEGILERSIGIPLRDVRGRLNDPKNLYQPYSIKDRLSIIFRDHELSDLIGFIYSKWDSREAANDLIKRLKTIRAVLPKDRNFIVPIILDGENAWEHYKNDGRDFLLYLYDGLSKEGGIKAATVSEYLKENQPKKTLSRLFSGSWIASNFSIWIGHEEDNLAWDMLGETREDLAKFSALHPDTDYTRAWKSIYIAEGSDWWWWYGDEHVTETQEEFDELFRLNLMNVYKEMGKDIPSKLLLSILKEDRAIKPTIEPRGFITPRIDGEITNYYEWFNAAYLEVMRSGGTMHKSESFITYIYYGFDLDNLYLRLDAKSPLKDILNDMGISFFFIKPLALRIDVFIEEAKVTGKLYRKGNGDWSIYKTIKDVACLDILEMAVPFKDIDAAQKDEVSFFVSLQKGGEEVERWPWRGYISLTVPSPEFEATMWT